MRKWSDWSFRVGRLKGIDVHIHWLHPIWMVFLFLKEAFPENTPTFLPQPYWALLWAVNLTVTFFVIVLLHEYGHCWMARRLGGMVEKIILWPLGGLAMVTARNRPRDEILVASAGPAVNVIIGGLLAGIFIVPLLGVAALNPFSSSLWEIFTAMPEWVHQMGTWATWGVVVIWMIYYVNVFLLIFNLLPAYPMDGGRILLGLLGLRLPPERAIYISTSLGMGFAVGMGFLGLFINNVTLLLIAFFVFYSSYQHRKAFEQGAYFYDDDMDTWGSGYESYSADNWRGEGSEEQVAQKVQVRRAGPIRRWLDRRRRVKARRRREQEVRVKKRVDELLEKISRTGMDSLNNDEQGFLKKASGRYRQDTQDQ